MIYLDAPLNAGAAIACLLFMFKALESDNVADVGLVMLMCLCGAIYFGLSAIAALMMGGGNERRNR